MGDGKTLVGWLISYTFYREGYREPTDTIEFVRRDEYDSPAQFVYQNHLIGDQSITKVISVLEVHETDIDDCEKFT